MLDSLRRLPAADMSKLATFDVGTDALGAHQLGVKPNYCFIDGEHTDRAVLRDARFCRAALDGVGIVAFHDAGLVKPAIRDFLREEWSEVSYAIGFGGSVFALELGDLGILRSSIVERAIASRWHYIVWTIANRHRHSSAPLLAA
jgi:hypothetical protein